MHSRKLELTPLDFVEHTPATMLARSADFRALMLRRRSVREFSNRAVPRQIIEDALIVAGSAPNGANLQPWHFVVIQDASIKAYIRSEAEAEERAFYAGRAPQEWLDALAPLGTDPNKPFLEIAPVLIAIFNRNFDPLPDGRKVKNYYVSESTGIATGMMVSHLHNAGLATLTHTPSPMGFLNQICGRPDHEKPFLLLVVGYPADDCRVPKFASEKKPLHEFSTWL